MTEVTANPCPLNFYLEKSIVRNYTFGQVLRDIDSRFPKEERVIVEEKARKYHQLLSADTSGFDPDRQSPLPLLHQHFADLSQLVFKKINEELSSSEASSFLADYPDAFHDLMFFCKMAIRDRAAPKPFSFMDYFMRSASTLDAVNHYLENYFSDQKVSGTEFYEGKKAAQKIIDAWPLRTQKDALQKDLIDLEKTFWLHQSYWSGFVCRVQILGCIIKDWWQPEQANVQKYPNAPVNKEGFEQQDRTVPVDSVKGELPAAPTNHNHK